MKNVSFIEDWITEGIQQGVEEGKQAGEIIGLQKSIIQVLLVRFDPTARAMEQVRQQLETIANAQMLQKSLDEALLSPSFVDFADNVANLVDGNANEGIQD